MEPSFQILTLNIAHGRGLALYQGLSSRRRIERNLDRVAALIRRHQPEIVALQEVDELSHWNRQINLLAHIQRKADYPCAWLGVHNRRPGKRPLAYGNALLSRFPIVESGSQPFGNKTLGEKGFTFGQVRLPGGDVHVINIHLDYRSRRRRIAQVQQVINHLETRHQLGAGTAPVICGDFNCASASERDAVFHLHAYLNRHYPYRLLPEGEATFPAFWPLRTLDFVYLPQSFAVESCRVLAEWVSDHRPVLLRCRRDFAGTPNETSAAD